MSNYSIGYGNHELEMPVISLIIPVYNKDKYLEEVLSATHIMIEILDLLFGIFQKVGFLMQEIMVLIVAMDSISPLLTQMI